MSTGSKRLPSFTLAIAIAACFAAWASADIAAPQEETLEEFTELESGLVMTTSDRRDPRPHDLP